MDEPIVDEVEATEPELADALQAAGLPTEDLTRPGRRFFRFRHRRDGLIGFIGWEEAGEAALLRSLVVMPALRGRGWCRRMAGWALGRLAEAGVADVYLLTTTIAPLAAKLGFTRMDRTQAPAAIQASRQFAALCPTAAALMHRRLP
jgi:N-acetylglutamate synthase-like GNAT family acetyltransferase